MKIDIVEAARRKKVKKEKRQLREAKSEDGNISLYLQKESVITYTVWCSVEHTIALKGFWTKDGAFKYFDEMMKRYNLKQA